MRQHGPWQIVSTREVYRDQWTRLVRDEVIRPDGLPGSYCVVHIKPGVSVLPIDDAGHVHLTQEFHYAVGNETLEVVSGGIDEGEEILAAAQRELKEELGIEAGEWTDLGSVDPFTATVLSPTQLFVARQLTFGETAHEGTEQIRRYECSLADAVTMVMNGQITHSPSCVLILKAARTISP